MVAMRIGHIIGISTLALVGLVYLRGRPVPVPAGPRNWRKRGEFWQWKGHQIFYIEEGEGPTLVLIHGFPTSSWDWQPIWSQLRQHYRVLAVDMLGFGFSDKPASHDYSLFEQADIVEALLQARGVSDYSVLAHDYGDTVALELLARNPSGLGAVCLLNGGIFMARANPRPIQKALKGPLGPLIARLMNRAMYGRRLAEVFGPQTQPTAEQLDEFWALAVHNGGTLAVPRIIRYMDERLENQSRWNRALGESSRPIRLIVGTQDPVSGENIAQAYEELVPSPDVVRLQGCGHYPQVEAPQQTVAAILEFLT